MGKKLQGEQSDCKGDWSLKEFPNVETLRDDWCSSCAMYEGYLKNESLMLFRVKTTNTHVYITYCKICHELSIYERTFDEISEDKDGIEVHFSGDLQNFMENSLAIVLDDMKEFIEKYSNPSIRRVPEKTSKYLFERKEK